MPPKLTKKEAAWAKLKAKLGTDCATYEEYMRTALAARWKTEVRYTCSHCLKIAFDEGGYVTDDDLILCSKGRLKHM